MDKYILFIYLGRRGAGNTYSHEMASAMLKKGYKLVCLLSEDIENKKDWQNLYNKYPESLTNHFISTYSGVGGFLYSLVFAGIKYKDIIVKLKATDIWCTYIPMLSMLTYVFARRIRRPLITTVHDVNQHMGESSIMKYVLDKLVIEKSDKLIVLSKKFIKELSEKYKKRQEDIYYIPHANFSIYVPENYKPDFDGINRKILFFGRIHKYKGLEVLLKAMCIVKETIPDIRLVIAGNGNVTTDEKNLMAKLGDSIIDNVRWISDDEIGSFFENIDFTVLPYIEASQSGVIPLSYSFGKSVVASDVGGLSEQVYEGCGRMIQAGNYKELAECIIELYKHPDLIISMNKEAYKTSNTILSWEYSSDRLSEIIELFSYEDKNKN